MLENARRQVFLVFVLAAAAIASLGFLGIRYGLDLKGGIQLIYEIDIPGAITAGDIAADASEAEIGAIVDETVSIVDGRVDPTGTLDAAVLRRGQYGFLVEVPDVQNEAEAQAIQSRIESLGQLEFRLVAEQTYVDLDEATGEETRFDIAAERERLEAWLKEPANRQLVQEDPAAIRVFNSLTGEDQGPVVGGDDLRWYPHVIRPSADNARRWRDAWSLSGYSNAVSGFEPEDYNAGQIPDSILEKPEGERFLVEFVPINMHEESFEGDDLNVGRIGPSLDDVGRPAITYQMRADQSPRYGEFSGRNVGKQSAIILNGEVYSAPVFRGKIVGTGQISGDFSRREVDELVKVLRTGALQVRPVLQSKDVIGAQLGRRSIELAMYSIAIGAVLVLGFILAYYRLAGLVAFAALGLNILLLIGIVAFFRSRLTLPGLSGLVLTMGMAVDANILIYERIREELHRGKDLLQACRTGFERAIVTILDANITTFIAGVVLFQAGVGPIRGFAVTLMIGIVTTLFTAFFVSRLVFHFLLESGRLKDFKVAHWLENVNVDFLSRRRLAFAASALVIVSGLAAFFSIPNDEKYAIDFTGGANLNVALREPATAQEIRDLLEADPEFHGQYENPIVNSVGELVDGKARRFSIRVKLDEAQRNSIDAERQANPDGYEPPYKSELRRALSSKLVDAPQENAIVDADPDRAVNFASIELHFADQVAAEDVKSALRGLAGLVLTPLHGEAGRSSGYRVEWDVAKEVSASQLFGSIQGMLRAAELKNPSGELVQLSDPIPESSEIGGRMVNELRNSAITALLIAMGAIVLFIRARFHEYKYGVAAVVALIHDVLVTLGAVVVANYLHIVDCEINLAMIAAFLTIIGYSINDTIVIFDRVRENLDESKRLGEPLNHKRLLNLSINQTLSRTLLTTATTMMVVLTQFLVNMGASSSLEGFSFALVIGLLSGTYSTIFIAAPVMLWLWKRERPDEEDPETFAGPSTAIEALPAGGQA